jgi:hypothetical protein
MMNLAMAGAPKTEAYSFMDFMMAIGAPGLVAVLVFIGGLAFAAVIHTRRLGFRHRMAFLPYTLLPLMVGFFGHFSGVIDAIRAGRLVSNLSGALCNDIGTGYEEIFLIMPPSCAGTIILLGIACILFLSEHARPIPTP